MNANISDEIQRAKQCSKSGQYGMAKEILLNLYESHPTNCHVLKGLGRISEKMEQYDDAKLYYEILLMVNNTFDIKIYHYIAQILIHQQSDYKQAEQLYLKSRSIDPYNSQTLFELAFLN